MQLEVLRLQDELERRKRDLPAEPAESEAGLITIALRMPEGPKVMRRFRQSDLV
jgi:hypothetical protein